LKYNSIGLTIRYFMSKVVFSDGNSLSMSVNNIGYNAMEQAVIYFYTSNIAYVTLKIIRKISDM
jgi:uncharacterized protein (UPF0297 family)